MARVKENHPGAGAALELMTHVFTTRDKEKQPSGTALLTVMWTANSENLTPDAARFVSVSSDTNLRDDRGKIIFDGGYVRRFTYDEQPEFSGLLYAIKKHVHIYGFVHDGDRLPGNEHAALETFVARHNGGYLLSLMGNKRRFNTGGDLRVMSVTRDGRVWFGLPSSLKDRWDLLALCKSVFEGDPSW